jgi:hypothetical integral membrane protein (TIGR02206 family)
MFDQFLTYRTALPDETVWTHFGAVHLCYLIGFALATVVLVLIYRRATDELRGRIRLAYACIVVGLEVIKQLLCLFTGVYEPGLLPFHLCGITIILIAIHTLRPNRWTAELLYSLSLPGAIAALLFADWNVYPLFNFFCQQSFFIHFFEFSYPILLIASGELRPRFTRLWRSVVFLLVTVPPLYFFNHAFSTNFFFINEAAADSPLSFLQSALGNPGYLFGFVALLFAVWLVLYLPWLIKTLHDKRQSLPPKQA